MGQIMGLGDTTKKAQEFLGDNKVTGNKFEEQIEGARAAAGGKIGTEQHRRPLRERRSCRARQFRRRAPGAPGA